MGAGPVGCVFATTDVRRGHAITLFEASGSVGGKYISGSAPKIKFDVRNYFDCFVTQLHECEISDNLKLKLNTPVVPDELKKQGFDSVIFTRGNNDISPLFEESVVSIDRNTSDTVPDPYNTWQPVVPSNVSNHLAKEIKQ